MGPRHGIVADVLGDAVNVEIDQTVYSDAAVFKAAYWLTDRFYLYFDRISADRIRLEIRNKPGGNQSLDSCAGEFCNALIDFSVRETVLKQTGPIREMLAAKAFAEGVAGVGASNRGSE